MRKLGIKPDFIIPLIILPFYFKPFYVIYNNLSVVNSIYVNGLRIIFIFTLIKYMSRRKISKFILFLGLFYLIKGISTIMNNGDISSLITECYPSLGICMFIEIWSEKNIKQFIRAFTYVFTALTINTFITILLKPDGYETIYEKIYFQRPGNQMASFCILGMFFFTLYSYLKDKNKKNVLTWIMMILNTYIIVNIKSSSGLISWFIFTIYFIVPNKININKLINFKRSIVLYVSFSLSIIVFRIQDKFSFLIVDILDKDITFTGRTILWDKALDMIKEKPIIGYGMNNTTSIIYSSEQGKFLSAHNQFIQLIIEGGFLSLIFFSILVYLVYKQVKKCKLKEIQDLVTISSLSIGFVLFSEAMGFFDLIIVLSIAFQIKKIDLKCSEFSNINMASGSSKI